MWAHENADTVRDAIADCEDIGKKNSIMASMYHDLDEEEKRPIQEKVLELHKIALAEHKDALGGLPSPDPDVQQE